ncbi:hypothetical protein KXV85_006099, partial [Aspergillus fumigatus]
MADEAVGGAEQFAAHAGIADEGSHQQEHRNHAEGVVGHRAHRGLPDQFQRRREAGEIAEACDADEAHRHADRHAQQHQRKQRDKSEDGNGVGAHCRLLHGLDFGFVVHLFRMEDQAIGADRDQEHGGEIAGPGHREERPGRHVQVEGQHIVVPGVAHLVEQ